MIGWWNSSISRQKEAERMLALSDPRPGTWREVLAYAKDTKGEVPVLPCPFPTLYISVPTKDGNAGRVTP